jgi:DNA-binding IclR family transcriptional regulator
MNKELEYIFNRWGTYQSLQKGLDIVKFFMEKPEEKIRQKTIIQHFEGKMSAKTVREHLYRLVEKRILDEDVFKGTYIFFPNRYRDLGVDMDRLLRAIAGKEIYDMARRIWLEKNQFV